VIEYRTFLNPDPPALVEVWNGSFTGRGAVSLRLATLLEFFIFSKPYFDPEGLVVAAPAGRPPAFAPPPSRPHPDRPPPDPPPTPRALPRPPPSAPPAPSPPSRLTEARASAPSCCAAARST